jgi:hypothetical protein
MQGRVCDWRPCDRQAVLAAVFSAGKPPRPGTPADYCLEHASLRLDAVAAGRSTSSITFTPIEGEG